LPGIPSDLQTIVTKCLMKEPSQRYATATELADELQRWLDGDAIVAHPPSSWYLLRKKAFKWRVALARGGAGVLLAGWGFGWVLPELSRERAQHAQRDAARPYLDEGRKLEARLDRLLTTEAWTPKDVQALLQQCHAELDRALSISPGLVEALIEKGRAFQYEN